ncbi:exosome complex component Rrp40 [Lycorma delicatula]|uniref:exosome complex component Rrp40 n=1 Tax=Lycorma delicatula TaxID=130591 RepID=UPI003F515DC8
MDVHINGVVIPGDKVTDIDKIAESSKVILGPGLRRFEGKVLITKSGILKQRGHITFWVDCQQKRYVPSCGEFVIGIVTNKAGDYFKVDIGSSEMAALSYLSFEGATKKNRPDINVGDALYTKILSANKDMEPELVCVDSDWKKGFAGLLDTRGFIFTCSLNLVHKVLSCCNELFNILGRLVRFEVAVGMNGRIWIKSENYRYTLAIINTILSVELMTKEEMLKRCPFIFLNKLEIV